MPDPFPWVVPLTAEVVMPKVSAVWAIASAICSSTVWFTLAVVSQAAWYHGSSGAPAVPPKMAASSAVFGSSAPVNKPPAGIPLLMNPK